MVAAAHRAQADALDIEAKRRLADGYDTTQERVEVARDGPDAGGECAEAATVVSAIADTFYQIVLSEDVPLIRVPWPEMRNFVGHRLR